MKLLFHREVYEQLRRLPRQAFAPALDLVTGLATDPRPPGAKKLAGQERWRVRAGEYRVLYTIDDADRTVRIERIAHRSAVYRD
ncbi:type II toxin-antitoxin system RelE/ParE family toxin [Streptomyces polyrhachis]|uniref:Type II toxin-antitoxin system RelE/ParE family toxin n=1 Tax=Streptomyces polyrhachis TaxID=1282885 RepID=A0ABW2GI91_9ACTN